MRVNERGHIINTYMKRWELGVSVTGKFTLRQFSFFFLFFFDNQLCRPLS